MPINTHFEINGKQLTISTGAGVSTGTGFIRNNRSRPRLCLAANEIKDMSDAEIIENLRAYQRLEPEIDAILYAYEYSDIYPNERLPLEKLLLIFNSQLISEEERINLISGPSEKYEPKTIKRKDQKQDGYIYFLQGGGYVKIGLTTREVDERTAEIVPRMPFETQLIHHFYTDSVHNSELELHERFSDKRIHGEWFELDDSDIAFVKSLGG